MYFVSHSILLFLENEKVVAKTAVKYVRILNRRWYQHGVLTVLKLRLCSFEINKKTKIYKGRQKTHLA